VLELLKPVTWFPPRWAFGCGAVSAVVALTPNWQLLLAGIALSGPLVCGMSQSVNDWYDRHVDAINEPNRPNSLRHAAFCWDDGCSPGLKPSWGVFPAPGC
jgi:chlorophyll synthase